MLCTTQDQRRSLLLTAHMSGWCAIAFLRKAALI